MRSRPIHVVLVILAFVVVPAFALPPNLVKGGTFDTSDDLQQWRAASASAVLDWQGIDAQSRSTSGSATVQGIIGGLTQCIPITAGREYDFGARALIVA